MNPIPKELEKKIGIYCLLNTQNNKKYIGSSKNLRNRLWEHRSTLRHNNHDNPYLQNAWNKYGEESFLYYILEYCDINILIEKEQFYIDSQNPEYNINKTASTPPNSKESRKRQSKTRKEKMKTGEIPITNFKKIYQYSLDGIYIREYPSIRQAILDNNMCRNQILLFLKGKYNMAGGFLWSLSKEESLPQYIKNTKKPYRKRIRVYNDTENYEFNNVHECAEYFNVYFDSLRNSIKNKRVFQKKYMIEYISAV